MHRIAKIALAFVGLMLAGVFVDLLGSAEAQSYISSLRRPKIINGSLTFPNGETINNDTDGTFDFTRDDAGAVTLTASDDDATAALIVDPGGAAALTLGSADVTGIAATAVLGFRVPTEIDADIGARTCDATNQGYIVYVEDTDDTAAGQLCACMQDGADDATYDWRNLDAGGADCTLL